MLRRSLPSKRTFTIRRRIQWLIALDTCSMQLTLLSSISKFSRLSMETRAQEVQAKEALLIIMCPCTCSLSRTIDKQLNLQAKETSTTTCTIWLMIQKLTELWQESCTSMLQWTSSTLLAKRKDPHPKWSQVKWTCSIQKDNNSWPMNLKLLMSCQITETFLKKQTGVVLIKSQTLWEKKADKSELRMLYSNRRQKMSRMSSKS